MLVWKCRLTALQKEHAKLQEEHKKAVQVRNAYMAVLAEIGEVLMSSGAPSSIGLVAGVQKLAESTPGVWDAETDEAG